MQLILFKFWITLEKILVIITDTGVKFLKLKYSKLILKQKKLK